MFFWNLQHRRLSYSRHAVDDRDLSTQVILSDGKMSHKNSSLCIHNFFSLKVNYKMRMNIRRMATGERKHHKRSKRLNKVKTH